MGLGRRYEFPLSSVARPSPELNAVTIFDSANIFYAGNLAMIRKLASGQYRLYSRKKNPRTGRRRNLGTFGSRAAAEKHERAVQYFKRH
jgi:hypothetical protein